MGTLTPSPPVPSSAELPAAQSSGASSVGLPSVLRSGLLAACAIFAADRKLLTGDQLAGILVALALPGDFALKLVRRLIGR